MEQNSLVERISDIILRQSCWTLDACLRLAASVAAEVRREDRSTADLREALQRVTDERDRARQAVRALTGAVTDLVCTAKAAQRILDDVEARCFCGKQPSRRNASEDQG